MTVPSPPYNVVLIGYGQIARNQHAPILQSRQDFHLVCLVDPSPPSFQSLDGIPVFDSLATALKCISTLDVAVIACPPHFAQDYTEEALRAGLSVLMEKPPGLDIQRLAALQELAANKHATLYTAYHSTHCPQLGCAKKWIQETKDIQIIWKESVAKWHANQEWISQVGFGVLDILINPMSMLETLLGSSVMEDTTIESSTLEFPTNWSTPIAGSTVLQTKNVTIKADYAWNHDQDDIWSIVFSSASGNVMELSEGGANMTINGVSKSETSADDILRPEYESLYTEFESLLQEKESKVCITPLRIICDIFQKSKRVAGDEYTLGTINQTKGSNHDACRRWDAVDLIHG